MGIVAWINSRPPLVVAVNVLLGIVAAGAARAARKSVLQQLTMGAVYVDTLSHVSARITEVPVPAGP
jgi:hypothetical protein